MTQIIFNTTKTNELMQKLINVVSADYEINPLLLVSTSQQREVVEPRQVVMYAASELTRYSLAQIGSHFEGRKGKKKDHATVIHAVKSINNLMDTNKEKKALIKSIITRCDIAINGEPIHTPDQTIIVDKLNSKFITFIGFKQEEVNDLERIIVNNFTK